MRFPLTSEQLAERLKTVQKLKEGFDLLNDHVVIADENANILYANKAVEKNTGFPLNEVIGKNPADLWGGNMPKEFYEKMWHTIKEEKQSFVGEVNNTRKDGTKYWQELRISPILDENGKVKFFIGIEPNITERKEREKFKEEFTVTAGHQLRNPLNTVRWILEKVLSDSTLNKEEREDLLKAYKESVNLSYLVSDLLILAHIEKGPLHSGVIDLEEELGHIISLVHQAQPQISFSFKNNYGQANLNTVGVLALQVFSNIIHNAAEHADKTNGIVDISLEKAPQGIIFACHNNGPPIPRDFRSLIFSKVLSTTGAGLGLFITKMICDQLGWQVSFETEPGGTTFFVVMPTRVPA